MAPPDDSRPSLKAPRPVLSRQIPRVLLATHLSDLQTAPPTRDGAHTAVPDDGEPQQPPLFNRRPLYSTIEVTRESFYNLDYPQDRAELEHAQTDPSSRFYARDHPRTLRLLLMLPYATELPADQAKFLLHIVLHLYIAIKTLDIQGLLPVTAKDLAEIKDVVGVLDIDLALETNLFVCLDHPLAPEDQEMELKDLIIFEGDLDDDDDDDDEDDGDADDTAAGPALTQQHKRLPKLAAVVGVRTWTQELLVWLKMKYDMPIRLRMALARVYYALCLCRGQDIALKTYVKAFEVLTKHTRFMAAQGLRLPWRPLYQELENHLPLEDIILGPVEVKDQKQLLRLATRAASFFDPREMPAIYEAVAHNITFSNALLVMLAMCLVPNAFGKETDRKGETGKQESETGRKESDKLYEDSMEVDGEAEKDAKELGGKTSGLDCSTTSGLADNIANSLTGNSSASADEFPSTDSRHYLDSWFYIWQKLNRLPYFEDQITLKLGAIAMEACYAGDRVALGPYGIFSEAQFVHIVNTCMNCLLINSDKYGLLKTKYFHGFALAIVYLLTPANAPGILAKLRTLFNCIELYGFPLNAGEWLLPIAKLVYLLCYQLQKRRNLEREPNPHLRFAPNQMLDDATVATVVDILLPMVRTGVHSKGLGAVDNHLMLLGILAQMAPAQVLAKVVPDMYELLEGLILTHRVSVALRLMEELLRHLAATPVYRVHLVRLLSMALPGIDSNDLDKTIHTLDAFATVANFVPFADLSDGDADPGLALEYTSSHLEHLRQQLYVQPDGLSLEAAGAAELAVLAAQFEDPELEQQALVLASSSFSPLVLAFCQRLFTLLENIPDPTTNVGMEKDVTDLLPRFLYVIIEALSDPLFVLMRTQVFDWVFSHTFHTIAEVAGEICGALVKRDPAHFASVYEILKAKIVDEIDENGAGGSRTGADIVPRDQALFWNLIILNECIGNAGHQVVVHGDDLMAFSFYLMDKVKGPAIFALLYIVNQMLLATTKIRLAENRLFDPLRAPLVADWAGQDRCASYQFQWFIPQELDIAFAVDCFAKHVQKTLENILGLIHKHPDTSLTRVLDDFRLNLLYLCFCLLGVAHLLDPLFDEDIPRLDHAHELLQHRLMLLNQLRQKGHPPAVAHVETADLERVVDDISDLIAVGERDDDEWGEVLATALPPGPRGARDALPDAPKEPLLPRPERLQVLREEDPLHSRLATPLVDGVVISLMNPAITFRERKLYTSSYYFGDEIDQRRGLPLYLKLHRTRNLIGQLLHLICRYFIAHFAENTKLFKHFLYVINIYFSDVGRERVLDPSHARISYGYIKCIQEINRVRKPYTRMAVGARLEQYHQLRVALHATLRNQTPLDKLLIEDIVKLLVSTYTDIAVAAQHLVVDILKRINGLYGIVVRQALRWLTRALDEKNYLKVQLGLGIFDLKRVKLKIQNDYVYVERFVDVLQRCIAEVDLIPEVQAMAKLLYQSTADNLTPPLAICIIDEAAIDVIRPPDAFIDVEIRAVRAAKHKKRKVYMDKLASVQATVLRWQQHTTVWWNQMINILLVSNLQIDLGVPLSLEVMAMLAHKAQLDHPNVLRLALKGLTNVVNKVYQLQLVEYVPQNAYRLDYVPHGIATVATQGPQWQAQWQAVVTEGALPFYMDTKPHNGWLFWGPGMRVQPRASQLLERLSDSDKAVLSELRPSLTLDWLRAIVRLWVTENELNLVFQGLDANFFALVVMLAANGYTSFTLSDMLALVTEIYVRDEKATHMMCCELIAGIFMALTVTPELFFGERDAAICAFLTRVFDDLTPDTKEIWNIFAWWLPAHVDIHRFPLLFALLSDVNLDGLLDLLIRVTAPRIGFLRLVLVLLLWLIPEPQKYLDLCLAHLDFRYETVRNQIGLLMAVLSFAYFSDQVALATEFIAQTLARAQLLAMYRPQDANPFLQMVPTLFERLETQRQQVADLPVGEVLHSKYVYELTTVITWLRHHLKTLAGIMLRPFVVPHIVPFLLRLTEMKEVCQLGNINPVLVFKRVSQLPFDVATLEDVVAMVEAHSGKLNVVQTVIMGEFIETIYFDNLFRLTRAQRLRIVAAVNRLVFSKLVEVREALALTLLGLIHMTPPGAEADGLVVHYKHLYLAKIDAIRKKHRKTNFKQLAPEDHIQLHGLVLGLGALVNAFLFTSPPPVWIPEILARLATRALGIPGLTGKTAKEILGRFKKNRQDSWDIDLKVFTEEQMQDLEGVLWKSYFI